jgi:hypothetical protein
MIPTKLNSAQSELGIYIRVSKPVQSTKKNQPTLKIALIIKFYNLPLASDYLQNNTIFSVI